MDDQTYNYFGSRNLRLTSPQMQGTDVKILQSLLNMFPDNIVLGNLVVDGIFGPVTRNAVRSFQKYFGLVTDGIVGPESFLRLGHRTGKYAVGEAVFSSRTLRNGARGGDVTVLQNRLAACKKAYLNRPADGRFENLSRRELFLSKDRKTVALLANDGRQIIIYNLATGIVYRLNLAESIDYLDWSYDGSKLVLNNGLVINVFDGSTIFSFTGMMPQWFTDNKNLLYSDGVSSLRKIDIETGNDQLVLELPDYYAWFFQLAAPINKLIVMGFVDPGRVTFTFLYDLTSKKLTEISRNDFFAQWSRTFSTFLLLQRDYFGEFFPWFYLKINQYSREGVFKGQALYGKDVNLNNGNFASSDQAFLAVLSNPATFYPIPVINRDIYARTLNSQLLTQLTAGNKTYSPVWL